MAEYLILAFVVTALAAVLLWRMRTRRKDPFGLVNWQQEKILNVMDMRTAHWPPELLSAIYEEKMGRGYWSSEILERQFVAWAKQLMPPIYPNDMKFDTKAWTDESIRAVRIAVILDDLVAQERAGLDFFHNRFKSGGIVPPSRVLGEHAFPPVPPYPDWRLRDGFRFEPGQYTNVSIKPMTEEEHKQFLKNLDKLLPSKSIKAFEEPFPGYRASFDVPPKRPQIEPMFPAYPNALDLIRRREEDADWPAKYMEDADQHGTRPPLQFPDSGPAPQLPSDPDVPALPSGKKEDD